MNSRGTSKVRNAFASATCFSSERISALSAAGEGSSPSSFVATVRSGTMTASRYDLAEFPYMYTW